MSEFFCFVKKRIRYFRIRKYEGCFDYLIFLSFLLPAVGVVVIFYGCVSQLVEYVFFGLAFVLSSAVYSILFPPRLFLVVCLSILLFSALYLRFIVFVSVLFLRCCL